MKPFVKRLLLLPCISVLSSMNPAAYAERLPAVTPTPNQVRQITPGLSVQTAPSPLAALPAKEQLALTQGRAVVTEKNGQYTARIVIRGTVDQVWSVLTDFNHYANFMPNMVNSKVLTSEGNQHLVEQVDRYRIFLFTGTARTRITITETPQENYSFQMVEGKLKKLQGRWSLQPIVHPEGSTDSAVLVTAEIEAQPLSKTPRGIFFNLFHNTLRDRIQAVNTEVQHRAR
jgi:ribosome-associated toxin RatA of RatAB toxin-antitoxin module